MRIHLSHVIQEHCQAYPVIPLQPCLPNNAACSSSLLLVIQITDQQTPLYCFWGDPATQLQLCGAAEHFQQALDN